MSKSGVVWCWGCMRLYAWPAIKASSHRAAKASVNSRWSCQFNLFLFGSIYFCLALLFLCLTASFSISQWFVSLSEFVGYIRLCVHSIPLHHCQMCSVLVKEPVLAKSRLCDKNGVSHSHRCANTYMTRAPAGLNINSARKYYIHYWLLFW